MQSMIPVIATSAAGAAAPPAATIGPAVEASEYAGPIEADESTETSKKRSTLGKCRAETRPI